ncbi:hypothetical protein BHM03_00026574 [Ensete ventricosum]|uniref:Uncharacterized protein n=1 Tax=Ensete ventricosum TaxID=4639 RepID=A0A445MH96_ENSVE|nr:hypothetical protein BHM03_00026574 [Ensete ventricosum]
MNSAGVCTVSPPFQSRRTHPFNRRSLHVTPASVYAVIGATGRGLLTNSDGAWTEAARRRPRSTGRSVCASGGLRSKRTKGPPGGGERCRVTWRGPRWNSLQRQRRDKRQGSPID